MRKFSILFILLFSISVFAKGNRQDDPSYQVDHNRTKNFTPTQHYLQEEIEHVSDNISLSSTGRIISGSKILTDGSAVGIFEVAIPSNTSAGGTVSFSVKVFDGTDLQNETGFFSFNGVNKAGTVTSDINRIRSDLDGADTRIITGGMLNLTLSTTNGAGKITINLNANTSLTPTSFIVNYTIMLNGNEVVTKL